MDPDTIAYIAAIVVVITMIIGYMWHRKTTLAEAIQWTDEFFDFIRGKDDDIDGHIDWLKEHWKEFLKTKQPEDELPDIPNH